MAQSFAQYYCRLFADFLRSAKPHKSAEGFVFFAQRKTKKPHGYSFSEHPCGFMAWSRIRDSNPPPTAWEAVALPDELTLQVLIYISRFCWLCQQVSGRDFRLFGFWGRSAPENRWIYRPEMKKSFSFDGFMVYCAI